MSYLEVTNLRARYDAGTVLKDVSFSLDAGGALGILGANGAGKSTTLRAISGMVRTTCDRLEFDGKSLLGLSPDQVARRGIAHVPEGRGTLPQLTVRENLLVGAFRRRNRREIHADLEYCLELFPQLRARLTSHGAALSGGEQQMLAISRAIMARPKLILLDEASLGLAPSTAQTVYRAIAQMSADRDISLLLVEQNASLAFSIVDSVIVLENGHVVASGLAAELSSLGEIRDAYLGG